MNEQQELTEKLKQATMQEKAALKTKRQARDTWRRALYHVRRNDMYNEFLLQALSKGVNIKYFDYNIKNREPAPSFEKAEDKLSIYLEAIKTHEHAVIVFDEALKDAWQNDIPLLDISEAIGKEYDSTYYALAKQTWFKKRRKDNKVK